MLSLPRSAGPWPVAVVLHGGFWRTANGLEGSLPLAEDLTEHGFATWVVEYRRVGDDPDAGGGGWPDTCLDVAAAVDLLATAGQDAAAGRLDLLRVVAIGHSAGGHLAGWLAGRTTAKGDVPGSRPTVPLTGFVSQAGVLDLAAAEAEDLGAGAVAGLLGPRLAGDEARYRFSSPIERLPSTVASICVHGTADEVVPISQSERFVRAARRAGDSARLVAIEGADHSAPIHVHSAAWAACRSAALELTGAARHSTTEHRH
jgi:acetyl esterase/lipase